MVTKKYCIDSNFHFTYQEGRLDIVNYEEIVLLEENRITLKCSLGLLVVKGKDLSIAKLLDQEILIDGWIQSIELG